jgi:hypothetical protein
MGAGSKAGQGALVEQVMIRSSQPLIDIGVNLVDDCFDKVRHQLAAASVYTLMMDALQACIAAEWQRCTQTASEPP